MPDLLKQKRVWTKEEDRLLVILHELSHAGWGTIGVRLNRRASVCATRYLQLKGDDHRAPIKTVSEIDADTKMSKVVAEERERRIAAQRERDDAAAMRGDLTAYFCGDPPPGMSALDKRRAST